jgi:hypothetical protein
MTNATAALRLEGLTHAFGPTEVLQRHPPDAACR